MRLKHFLSVFLTLLTLSVGQMWGATTSLAEWTFISTSKPANSTNFNATSGTMSTSSTFYLNGSGSTWNSTKSLYAFTAVTDITITLTLNQAAPAGTVITLSADTYYNKDKNAPMTGFSITAKEGTGSFGTTGLSVTSWSLSTSTANKSVTYTTQAALASGKTIVFKLTQTGKAGAGEGYFNNVAIKATTYSVTYNDNGKTSGSVPTDNTKYLSGATVTVASNSGNLAKNNYTFGGWNTNTSGTGTNYAAGSGSFTITADKTLYAKWNSAAVSTPTLTLTGSGAFGNVDVDATKDLNFTLAGSNLTANASVEVTGTGFSLVTPAGGSLTQTAGSITGSNNITVRFAPTAGGAHNGTLTVSSTGASDASVSLSGTGQLSDTFIDELHSTTGYTSASPHVEKGSYGTTPTIADKPTATSGTCAQQHYHFVGWITAAKFEAGTSIAVGDLQSPTSATGATYYAVWAKASAGASFNGSTGGDFLIYANISGTNKYATNTISSGGLSTTTTASDAQVYTFTKSGDDWTISYQDGNTTKYLTAPTGNDGNLSAFSTTATTWKLVTGSYGSWRIYSRSSDKNGDNTYSHRGLYYQTTANAFKNYATSNVDGTTYYDCEIGSATTYTDYKAVCCTELAQINGSFNEATQTTGVLKWKQLSDQVDSWTVTYREKNSGNAFAAVTTSSTTTETISEVVYNKYTISGLAVGKTYEFKLTPTLNTGVCALSEDLIVEGSTQASYTITEASSNTDHGTVSLSGVVITATPATGYGYASPAYTVSPANSATVVQNGNEFTVTPSANTTVTINFVQQNYAVTMAKDQDDDAIVISADQSNKHYNDQITVSVTNHDGYMFTGWEASPAVTFANASSESTTFTMPASNVTVTAKFIKVLAVAEAREVIDGNDETAKQGVYVKGIVSGIATAYNSTYHNISYNLSDDGLTTSNQLQAFRGKSYSGADFSSEDDIKVGDEVVVHGNITYYSQSSLYEFTADNQLYSLKRLNSISVKTAPTKVTYTANEQFDPAGLVITLNYTKTDANGSSNESKDVTYNNTTAAGFTFSPTTSANLNATNTAVTITYKGKSVNQNITVNRIATELGWSAASYEATQGDSYQFPTLTTITPAAIASSVTYSSTNTNVATINASGVITVKTHGETTIKADFAQTNVYAAATTASYTLTINEDMTPRLVVDPSSLSFTNTPKDDAEGKTFNLTGTHLTANATLAITGTNASMFSVVANVDKNGSGAINQDVTVTYTPTAAGSHSATLTICSTDAADVTVALSGTALETDIYKSALHTSVTAWEDYADGVKKAGNGYSVPNPGSVTKGSDNCEGNHYHFAGWVEEADKEAPSGHIVAASGTKNAAGKVYWAVWEKETSVGEDTYEMTTSVAVNDVVVIAQIDHIITENTTGTELSGFSSTSTVYGTHSEFTTLPAGTLEWIVEEGYNKTGVAFKNGNNYLYWGSGNSLSTSSDDLSANMSWSVETDSERAKITNNGTNTRVICWNEGSPRFAAYDGKSHGQETSNGTGKYFYYPVFYKKVPGVVYGDPITYCCTPHDITISSAIENGTVEADPESACAGAEVELTATPDEGYEFGSWTVTYVDGESQTQPVSVTNNKFSMPDFATTVSATFIKIAVTGVTINGYNSVAKGDNITLTLDITPSTARPTVVWSSSNDAIATVVNGVVTGVAQGSVTITAKVDGTDYTKDITVTRETKLNSISAVSPKTTYTLNEAFVAPRVDANYLYVDDESAAPTLENVEGASFEGFDNQHAGEYTITVTYGGKTTTYDVTVSAWTLNLQTKAQTGPSTVTPNVVEVPVTTYGSEIDLTDYYVANLCNEYTQVGFIASSTDVDSDEEPENLLTAYIPTADNQTLYAVFSHTGYTGETLVEEDFSSLTEASTNKEISTNDFSWMSSESKVFPEVGYVKFGSGSYTGSITTIELDLSHKFKVSMDVKKYSTEGANIKITADETDWTSSTSFNTSEFTSISHEFSAVGKDKQITIETSSANRAYIDNIKIETLDEVGYTSVYDCRLDMTVTYVIADEDAAAGATGACAEETVKQGNDYTVCTDEPTWAGHEFAGWSDGENIVGATIENVQSAITLTATWTEIVATSIALESDDITAGAMTLDDGRTATLTVTFDPTTTYNKTITWSTDSHYTITDNGDGSYNLKADNYTTEALTVTATTANSKSASFSLTINEATKLTGLTLEGLTTANTVYTIGDVFSTEGIVVNTTVNMGEAPQDVEADFSEPDMTTSGVKTITVEYEHAEYGPASTTYEITVNPKYVHLYKNETKISTEVLNSTAENVTLPDGTSGAWESKIAGYNLIGFADAADAKYPKYAAGAEFAPKTPEASLYALYTNVAPTYTLISSDEDLEIGRSIIIATKDAASNSKHYAIAEMKYNSNGQSNNRGGVDVSKGDNGTTLTSYAGATEFILMEGKETGTYALYDPINGGYLCATNTSNNYMRLEETLSEYGSWTITSNTVTASSGTRNCLFFNYNGGNTIFSCYQANAQNMKDIAVYQSDVPVKYDLTQDLVIESDQTLNTADVDQSVNVIVKDGVKLTVGSALSVNDFTIESKAGSSGQLLGTNVSVTGDIYMDVKFYSAATLDETSANQWYMISAPFAVNLNGGFQQTNGTAMVFGTDFDLFYYDGQKRANTGVTGWTRVQGQMPAGRACLIGFNEGQSTTIRLKAASNAISDPTSITLSSFAGDADNANWNGVANPRFRYTNINKDVHVWNNEEGENGRKYTVFSASQYSFVVGTPFFVQDNTLITLSDASHSGEWLRAPKREANERIEYCVRITREGATEFADQMYVRASEEATNAYEQGHDMITWNGTSGKSALIWAENYGMRLAIEEAPLVGEKAIYTLGVFAPADGEYTLSCQPSAVSDQTSLYLTKDGSIIWNLSESAYTAELTKGTNNGYGLLLQKKAPMTPTGVEQSEFSDQPSVQKIIIDEHVYILRGEQLYDVTGKAVK